MEEDKNKVDFNFLKNDNENSHLDYNSKNENKDEFDFQKNDKDKQLTIDMVMSSEILSRELMHVSETVYKKGEKFRREHPELANNPEELGKLYDEEWDRENEKQDKENNDLGDDMEQ